MELPMVYTDEMRRSIAKVEATRPHRLNQVIPRLTPDEKEKLLATYHPDYRPDAMRLIRVGQNKGDRAVQEFVDVLESYSRINHEEVVLDRIDFETDVLIIGSGGAGLTAAIYAHDQGAKVLIATKLRLGDANTVMAEGGIAAATTPQDSPLRHFIDTMGGGRFTNVPELVEALVHDAPLIINWLLDLGMGFGREADGTIVLHASGGHSLRRNHTCKDIGGLELIRVLRDEVRNRQVHVLEFCPAVELLLDEEGKCSGAVLFNLDTKQYLIVRAKTVIMATGGLGRLHPQKFPTTNHYGATADGLVMGYRAGAKLVYMDAIQYHPTGTAWPEQVFGLLVSESSRANGAQLVNKDGERFIFELETRDAVASAIIRECGERGKGVPTPNGMFGVWLDTPVIDLISDKGKFQRRFPHIYTRFIKYGIDGGRMPILVYPTQHYQNGGILINAEGETCVPNLYMAGEVSGGVHGRNRLGSNSLTDILVFGRRAGIYAGQRAKKIDFSSLTLNHIRAYHRELDELGIDQDRKSPILFPVYTPEQRARELALTAVNRRDRDGE